jgi:hypothetical protein
MVIMFELIIAVLSCRVEQNRHRLGRLESRVRSCLLPGEVVARTMATSIQVPHAKNRALFHGFNRKIA